MHGNGEGFQTHLSFLPVEWYLAEDIARKKAQLDAIDDRQRLKLTMSIFPVQNSSLLHIIAAKTSKQDQSGSVSQIRTLLEAEQNFVGEEITEDERTELF